MAKLDSVLIIDDNEKCIEFISLALEATGTVNVSSETVPVRALERIRNERPGLVLLDIKMPDVDGFALLSLLRGEGNTLPIVMLSGSARQADIDRAYALGCNGYLEKPSSLADYRAVAASVTAYWTRGELPTSKGNMSVRQ